MLSELNYFKLLSTFPREDALISPMIFTLNFIFNNKVIKYCEILINLVFKTIDCIY